MTRLAFAVKCGGFGARGLRVADCRLPIADWAAAKSFSFSNEASAIPPTPMPQRRKKRRRVTAQRSSCEMNCCLFMRLRSDDRDEEDVRIERKRGTSTKQYEMGVADAVVRPILVPAMIKRLALTTC